jgi:chitinase
MRHDVTKPEQEDFFKGTVQHDFSSVPDPDVCLGLPDPHPDSLVTCKAPDPSISHKSVERTEIMAAE